MKISDCYVGNYKTANGVIINDFSVEENNIIYSCLKSGEMFSWYLDYFKQKYTFSQKLTDEYIIKNIIE